MKVVVVVGPVETRAPPSTSPTRRRYASQARSYGATVIEIYSPNATWARVKAAAQGANVLIYLGHGNGSPSPYGAFSQVHARTASGSMRRPATATTTRSITASTTSRRSIRLAAERRRHPEPPVLRVGQLGVGFGQPDQVRREAARRQLRRGLPAQRRAGPSSRTGSPTRRTSCTACSRRTDDRRDLPELAELERQVRLRVPVEADLGVPRMDGSEVARPLLPLGHREPGFDSEDGARRQLIAPHRARAHRSTAPVQDIRPGRGPSFVIRRLTGGRHRRRIAQDSPDTG